MLSEIGVVIGTIIGYLLAIIVWMYVLVIAIWVFRKLVSLVTKGCGLMARESAVVNSIMKYLGNLSYCKAEKVVGNSNQKGRADINACYRGRCIRIEVKTSDNGNKASSIQKLNLSLWENAGAKVCVAYSVLDVRKIIEEIDEELDK